MTVECVVYAGAVVASVALVDVCCEAVGEV